MREICTIMKFVKILVSITLGYAPSTMMGKHQKLEAACEAAMGACKRDN